MRNEDFELMAVQYHDKEFYVSLLLRDLKKEHDFWVDCSVMNGYGRHIDKEEFGLTDDEYYLDWEFNQYIFFEYCVTDKYAKRYQENQDNIERVDDFISWIGNEIIENNFRGGM